jgi:hypothetical protein
VVERTSTCVICICTAKRLLSAVWHVEEIGRTLLGGLAAAVVARRSLDLGMASELLYCAEGIDKLKRDAK